MPVVSVLLPTYARNAGGFLSAAIESVLRQDFEDLELIIIDDGSSDGSQETIEGYARSDERIKVIRFAENVGVPAWTTASGFAKSTGNYIAWQFDDCIWEPDHLVTLLACMDQNPDAGVVYGKVRMGTGPKPIILGKPFDLDQLREGNFIPNCSTLVRRVVYETVGWVDPSILLKRINDYDLWVRAAEKFPFVFCDRLIATERGIELADSLGNSVSLFPELMKKYMSRSRDAELNISNLENWRPYEAPENANQVEREQFAFLIFEHFLRVRKFEIGLNKVENILQPERAKENAETPMDLARVGEIVSWFATSSMKMQYSNQRLLWEKQALLDEKQGYIDKQQAYIDEQQAYIDATRATIEAAKAVPKEVQAPALVQLEPSENTGRLRSLARRLLFNR